MINCCEEGKVQELIGRDKIIRKYNLPEEFARFREEMSELLQTKDASGKIIDSRNGKNKYKAAGYFQDKSQKGDARYIMFDKI
ncbi:hypothetical protein A2Y83_01575 [Candidatus Falkowbacteria bacterium RBG_13_39_14]|uniref:Uncharacterized protein n=1 Tax=Candidatus Falkowbacteria bacterium RBG_13_39_14 TaxID=1797985 RepID=A0A1F5S6C5_9BACT|nr:MAG: hypothetical protein A2Y83_01575 [Candidatus Falkowbacteria bacterium RBG_13_39_14]